MKEIAGWTVALVFFGWLAITGAVRYYGGDANPPREQNPCLGTPRVSGTDGREAQEELYEECLRAAGDAVKPYLEATNKRHGLEGLLIGGVASALMASGLIRTVIDYRRKSKESHWTPSSGQQQSL